MASEAEARVKFIHCKVCGNLFGVVKDSGAIPVCCGQPMTELVANSSDGAGEKHVPVLERNGGRLIVKVGEVAHPMQMDHYIQWIAVAQGERVQRVKLYPDQIPEAAFTVEKGKPVTAYEYCNLHGLWKAEG